MQRLPQREKYGKNFTGSPQENTNFPVLRKRHPDAEQATARCDVVHKCYFHFPRRTATGSTWVVLREPSKSRNTVTKGSVRSLGHSPRLHKQSRQRHRGAANVGKLGDAAIREDGSGSPPTPNGTSPTGGLWTLRTSLAPGGLHPGSRDPNRSRGRPTAQRGELPHPKLDSLHHRVPFPSLDPAIFHLHLLLMSI